MSTAVIHNRPETQPQNVSKRTIRRYLVPAVLVPIVALTFTVFNGSAAEAKTIASTIGYGTAHFYGGTASYFYGTLRDTSTPDGYCVELQRKTSSGTWTTSGFDGGLVQSCNTTTINWYDYNVGAVYGLRMHEVTPNRNATFCDNATSAKCDYTLN